MNHRLLSSRRRIAAAAALFVVAVGGPALFLFPQKTEKPVLHGRHWAAVTGKPMAATAGAMIFQKGGNAVDAACAMLGAVCTMWDVLSWGGETQALIYHPVQKRSSPSMPSGRLRRGLWPRTSGIVGCAIRRRPDRSRPSRPVLPAG